MGYFNLFGLSNHRKPPILQNYPMDRKNERVVVMGFNLIHIYITSDLNEIQVGDRRIFALMLVHEFNHYGMNSVYDRLREKEFFYSIFRRLKLNNSPTLVLEAFREFTCSFTNFF